MNSKLFQHITIFSSTYPFFSLFSSFLKALYSLYSHFFRVFQSILCTKKEEPKKNESLKRENKLKAFIKRSSEPLLNLHVSSNTSSQVIHSSEIRSLCLMKWPSEMLQNLSYFWNMKTYVFFFSFCATLFFSLKNVLVYVDIYLDFHILKM